MPDWIIKVRVVFKSDWRYWDNSNGAGKLFSCVLLDELKDEIDATFFPPSNDEAYDML
jgi:replication factor A1